MNTYLLLVLLVLLLLVVAMAAVAFLLRQSRVGTKENAVAVNDGSGSVRQLWSTLTRKFSRPGLAQNLPWILLLGERDSGKTTLLETLGTASDEEPANAGDIRWRLLDRGAITEVPADLLLTLEGKPQTDGRWHRLLKQLVHYRQQAPVNGIVLAVSSSQLLFDDEASIAKRSVIAAAIRSKLDDLQRITGLVVPIHVVITKCDQIRGFSAFCSETEPELRDEIFGWANPNTLQAAFSAAWVDEAFDAMQSSIVRRLNWVFGTRGSGVRAEELAILPLEFDHLRTPLRTFLTSIFHETAYVDSNFFRGIFFCGDGTAVRNLGPSTVTIDKSATPALNGKLPDAPREPVVFSSPARKIYFVSQLFEHRVFVEARVFRPVLHIRFARHRLVLATQLSIAIFALIFSIGTARAWTRLSDLRDRRFVGLLNAIAETISRGGNQANPSVQTAYDLTDTLGTIHADRFQSAFLPESWGDPLNDQIASALASAYSRIVFPALSSALDARGHSLTGSCQAAALPNAGDGDSAPALSGVDFRRNNQYQELTSFVGQYAAWQDAVQHYNMLRRFGTGSYSDLDALFAYLIGKGLRAPEQIDSSPYYQRALQGATGYQILAANSPIQDACASQLATSMVNHFYATWLAANPLLKSAETAADGIEDLEDGKVQQLEGASDLAQEIRDLDGQISIGNNQWLTQPEFQLSTYPALQQLSTLRFMSGGPIAEVTKNGNDELAKLKETLFSTGTTLSGPVLQQSGADVHVAANAIALEVGLASLLHQDFAGSFANPGLGGGKLIVWNTAALSQAVTLRDSYDKFVHTQIPQLPSSMQAPVKQLASHLVGGAVLAAVMNAQEPQQSIDDRTALLAIRSFGQAAPILLNLQESLPSGSTTSTGSFQMLLVQQSVALSKWLNDLLSTGPLYAYQTAKPRNTADAKSVPISFVLFGVKSEAALEEFLATQRERAKSLVQDYAGPLSSYFKNQGLTHATQFDTWAAISRDVQDYESKKPGNPIAVLETFIQGDLNKIAPANGCRAVDSGTVSSDYFNQIRGQLEQAAIADCAQIASDDYQSNIASFFNEKLAGKFPFGTYSFQAGVTQADPYDVATFLSRVSTEGPDLQKFFNSSPRFADQLAFIKACLGVKDMLAASEGNTTPASDVVVYFRVDREAEQGGNEIIDWSLQSGNNSIHYPNSTNDALRWHSGDPLVLSLRFAKDSPHVPLATSTSSEVLVDGRTVSWTYNGNWSLLALLNQHPGLASEFNTTPEMLHSTVRLAIPVIADTAALGRKVQPIATAGGQTKVFLRIGFRVPDPKQPKEAPVVAFPVQAPPPPAQN